MDVLNCAGYLGSGKVFINKSNNEDAEEPTWSLKMFPSTIAKDVDEKIRQCDSSDKQLNSNSETPNKSKIFNMAFAVAPRVSKREQTKIKVIDEEQFFTSLPEKIKSLVTPAKGNKRFNLRNSNWTDLNGDGVIDLIQISQKDDSSNSFESLFFLSNGKWEEIFRFQ